MNVQQSALFKKVHQRRVVSLLWVCVALLAGLGSAWSLVFSLMGRWDLVGLEVVLLITAGAVAWLTHHRRTRLAWGLVLVIGYVTLCLFAMFFDGHDGVSPRTSHLYFLVLTLASMLVFRNESPLLRWSTVAVLMASFVVFASSNWPHSSELFIPPPIRLVGAWINTATAMMGLIALVHIMLSEGMPANSLERDIDQGLSRGEFFLLYQPQVQADGIAIGAGTGRVIKIHARSPGTIFINLFNTRDFCLRHTARGGIVVGNIIAVDIGACFQAHKFVGWQCRVGHKRNIIGAPTAIG